MMVEVNQETAADIAAALKHLGWESVAGLHYWAAGNDIDRFDALVQAFAAHRIAERERCARDFSALEAEVLRLRSALDTICVHSNSDWDEVQADPAGKIKLIHTTAVAARFWREGDD